MSYNHVEIYTTPTCPDCRILKLWLDIQGIPYQEHDLTNPRIADEARRRTGVRVAPITIVDGHAYWGAASTQITRLKPLLDLIQHPV
jgi:glutaredoxin